MSKTIEATEQENPTVFKSNPLLRLTGSVRLHCIDFPDADNVHPGGPDQGLYPRIEADERRDCSVRSILGVVAH